MKATNLKSALGIFFLVALFLLLPSSPNTSTKKTVLPVNFFLPESFYAGQGKGYSKPAGHIYAALVPHHLVAGEIISGVFESLQSQRPKKIIIISPNHYEVGDSNIQGSSTNWQTPFGVVEGQELVPELDTALPATMVNEHGTAGLLPYVGYYIPKAKVFSVIVKYRTPDRQLEELAEKISKLIDNDTVVITSVDFSHYLPLPVAEQRDQLTKRLLLELSEKPLYTLNNDYLDSPSALSLMMKVCKKMGVNNFSITGHSNSATILNNPYMPSTTSHFAGACQESY